VEVLLVMMVVPKAVHVALWHHEKPWSLIIIGLQGLWEITLRSIIEAWVGEHLRNEQKTMGNERTEIRICTVGLANMQYVFFVMPTVSSLSKCFFIFCSENVKMDVHAKHKKGLTVDFNKPTGHQPLTLA